MLSKIEIIQLRQQKRHKRKKLSPELINEIVKKIDFGIYKTKDDVVKALASGIDGFSPINITKRGLSNYYKINFKLKKGIKYNLYTNTLGKSLDEVICGLLFYRTKIENEYVYYINKYFKHVIYYKEIMCKEHSKCKNNMCKQYILSEDIHKTELMPSELKRYWIESYIMWPSRTITVNIYERNKLLEKCRKSNRNRNIYTKYGGNLK